MALRAILSVLVCAVAAAHALTLSNTLGNLMVLQRDATIPPVIVWGFTNQTGVTVTTTFNGNTYTTTSGADGVWRQALPPTPAGGPYTINFTDSLGGNATLRDVMFGDVYLCSGQSNMQFTVANGFNATEEAIKANLYPNIRVFTVGQGTSSASPLQTLHTIEQNWTQASSASIGGPGWGYFSAVCWFFGRDLYDALDGKVPIGLISSNWGGTPVEHWSSAEALATCKAKPDGILWNAMIVPFATGPMSLKGFTWYQGETNVGNAPLYACTFPAMITDWRAKFQNSNAWFGFVQLAAWPGGAGTSVPELRTAQLAALKLPNVGYATAVDLGDVGGGIHPRNKQTVGQRLANYALAQVYGKTTDYLFPLFQGAVPKVVGNDLLVTVTFQGQTIGAGLQLESASCPSGVAADNCDNFDIQTTAPGNPWIAANASISADGRVLTLTAVTPVPGARPSGVRYGQSSWPVTTLFTKSGLPAIPFTFELTQRVAHVEE